MKNTSYTVLKDRIIDGEVLATKGSTVFQCWETDYGLSQDDTVTFGTMHISVTFDPDGGYPFFTIPLEDLKKND
jgi:hypothetical protein